MNELVADRAGRRVARAAPVALRSQVGRTAARVAVASGLAALVITRRTDALTTPQFWAEDGMIWYAEAYNDGFWRTVFRPYGGYFQTFQRLAATLSLGVELRAAPLVMNLVALLVQIAVPLFLLSDRMEEAVPGRLRRLVLALGIVLVPNAFEVQANVTNSHVHLALLAFLVLLAGRADTRAWRVFDVAVLLLSSASGPFCILLAPIALLAWWRGTEPWTRVRLLCVLAGTSVQVLCLLRLAGAMRAVGSDYGASVGNVLAILGGQIFVGGLAGTSGHALLHGAGWFGRAWLPVAIGAVGLLLVVRVACVTSSFALRALLLLAALHFSAALASPIIIGDAPLWELLQLPGAGIRYYYFSILAFLACVLWSLVADPRREMRVLAASLVLVLALVGVPGDRELPPLPDLNFKRQARRFHRAPIGKSVVLHTPPVPFRMVLVKR